MNMLFQSENLHARDNLEDLGVNERMILEWMLEKYGGEVWTGLFWLRLGTNGGIL